MSRPLPFLRLCLAFAVAAYALTARAYNLDTDRWKTTPVTMQLQLGTTPVSLIDGNTTWGAVAEDALATWNAVLTNFKFNVVRDSTAVQVRGNRINNVFFSPTIYADAFDSRTLAVTLISTTSTNGVSNGYVEADVLFNSAKSWNSYRGNLRFNGSTTINDFRRVAIHEFGHALGLDHPDDIGQSLTAVMNATICNTDTVAADDIAGARAIYDGGTTFTAPAITTQPIRQTVAAGASVSFSVTAAGTAPLAYQWRKDGTNISGATASTYTIASPATGDAGSYTVTITNSAGSITSTAATLTVTAAPTGPASRLSNLSVLTTLAARQSVTVGFTMSGGSKQILARAVGPGLASLGVGGALPDPELTLYDSTSTEIAYRDDYRNTIDTAATAAITAVGAFPLPTVSLDAALVRSISGGSSAKVAGSSAALSPSTNAGVVIVEVYDAGTGNSPRLTNLSALNFVGTGGNILTAGFTLRGTGTKRLLIRAVGPGLTALGVGGVLLNPQLEVYAGQTKLTSNDDWSSTLASTFASVGAFGLTVGSRDAALIVDLSASDSGTGYSVQVSGVNNTTGNAIIEVYELP